MRPAALLAQVGEGFVILEPGSEAPRRWTPEASLRVEERLKALEDPGEAAATRLRPGGASEIECADAASRKLAGRWGLTVREPTLPRLRELRRTLGEPAFSLPRAFVLARASQRLHERLSRPEEQVVLLSREFDRLERLELRDGQALESLGDVSDPGTPAGAYLTMARASQEAVRLRRQELGHLLELETRRFLPNASALVGARTAARLLALVGSPAALARAPSSRLQRLGSRPRGGPQAGPKYGVLYRAEGMDRVPPDRRGALARTLASLLGPALRADLITGGALGSQLSDRRERRIRDLNRTTRRVPARAEATLSRGRTGRPPRESPRSP